jgi:hypothetical protein
MTKPSSFVSLRPKVSKQLRLVRKYFRQDEAAIFRPEAGDPGDTFLAWLWLQGYKIVPLKREDRER